MDNSEKSIYHKTSLKTAKRMTETKEDTPSHPPSPVIKAKNHIIIWIQVNPYQFHPMRVKVVFYEKQHRDFIIFLDVKAIKAKNR